MASIDLVGVSKQFGALNILDDVNISIGDREFVVLVGPSGCGKSTLLRMIAGLEPISDGMIRIDGEVVNHLGPQKRDLAMVFQTYALYPHMTTAQNIGFPLKLRGSSPEQIERSVARVASTLHLETLLDRQPRALSGGQRQRVAMGRAMVREPRAFLFDEPLSNLDAKLRHHMRIELRQLHKSLGATSIYVTHDQIEAMTMADRIVVMRDGRILQTGTPTELYENPTDVFTARFIGSPSMNLIAGRRNGSGVELAPDGDILVGVRPHDLKVEGGTASGLSLTGTVTAVEPLGAETLVHLDVNGVSVIATAPGKVIPATGGTLSVSAPAGSLYLFDAKTEKSLGRL